MPQFDPVTITSSLWAYSIIFIILYLIFFFYAAPDLINLTKIKIKLYQFTLIKLNYSLSNTFLNKKISIVGLGDK